jgi:hypothetical protein
MDRTPQEEKDLQDAINEMRAKMMAKAYAQETNPSYPTVQEYAEHLAGHPLSPEDLQPSQPSLAKLRKDPSTK